VASVPAVIGDTAAAVGPLDSYVASSSFRGGNVLGAENNEHDERHMLQSSSLENKFRRKPQGYIACSRQIIQSLDAYMRE
jgi:hypothetical protein